MIYSSTPVSLSFTGSVWIQKFFDSVEKHLLSTLYIDWHNCILHYNETCHLHFHQRAQPSHFQTIFYWLFFSRPRSLTISNFLQGHMDALLQNSTCFRFRFRYSFRFYLYFPHRNPVNPLCPLPTNSWWKFLSLMLLSDTPSASDLTLVDFRFTKMKQFVLTVLNWWRYYACPLACFLFSWSETIDLFPKTSNFSAFFSVGGM